MDLGRVRLQSYDAAVDGTDIHRDYFEKSEEERRLVQKLDWFMLPALTLGWWIKNVDQSNVSPRLP